MLVRQLWSQVCNMLDLKRKRFIFSPVSQQNHASIPAGKRNRVQQESFHARVSKGRKVVKDAQKRKYCGKVQIKEQRNYGKQLLFNITNAIQVYRTGEVPLTLQYAMK